MAGGADRPGTREHQDKRRDRSQKRPQDGVARAWNRRAGGNRDAGDRKGADQGGAKKGLSPWNRHHPKDREPYEGIPVTPPKLGGKIIPGPKLDVPPLKGQDKLPPLGDHNPSAPPRGLFGPNKHVKDTARPEKSVKGMKPDAPLDGKHDWVFPPETVHRSDRLSPQEKRERQRVEAPKDGRIGFAFNSAKLTDEARSYLKDFAATNKGKTIRIDAHASRPGSDQFNDRLSQQRADAVRDYLVKDLGVDPKKVEAHGHGEREAAKAGHAERKDDAADRVAVLEAKNRTDAASPVTRESSILDLQRAVLEARVDRDLTPAWARDGATIRTSDGNSWKVSDKELAQLEQAVTKWANTPTSPTQQPELVGSALFLPNSETGLVSWVHTKNVPEGVTTRNNHWIHRKGRAIEVQSHFPEKADTIAEAWRISKGLGRLNSFGKENRPDEKTLRHLQESNRTLNQEMSKLLQRGYSISEAREKVSQQASLKLKQQILKMFQLSG